MSSFGRQFSPSPVLIMSPQPVHQTPMGMANFTHHAPRSFGMRANQFASLQSSRPSAAGRKRSRDEASDNLEPEPVPSSPVEEPETEWEYGPGMTLIKPSQRYVTDASSQSGTWLEAKKAAEIAARKALLEDRPVLRSAKSQRIVSDAGALASAVSSTTSSFTTALPTSSPESPSAPIIDNFTLHLGIGWRRISEDVDIQAAARGWARFIENHYPVSNVRILLESKGLESYLIEASEGFFLFAENLRQGQLVSQTTDSALRNLQSNPPIFEGTITMSAAESPRPVDMHSGGPLADTEMHMD